MASPLNMASLEEALDSVQPPPKAALPESSPRLLRQTLLPSKAVQAVDLHARPYTNITQPKSAMTATVAHPLKRSQSLRGGKQRTNSMSDFAVPFNRRRSFSPDPMSDVLAHDSSPSKAPETSTFLDLFVGKGLSRTHVPEPASNEQLDEGSSISASTSTLPGWFDSFFSLAKAEAKDEVEGTSTKTENRYLEEEDKADEGDPEWARIKENYAKPELPLVFCHVGSMLGWIDSF